MHHMQLPNVIIIVIIIIFCRWVSLWHEAGEWCHLSHIRLTGSLTADITARLIALHVVQVAVAWLSDSTFVA